VDATGANGERMGHRRQTAAVGVRGTRRADGSERREGAVPGRVGGGCGGGHRSATGRRLGQQEAVRRLCDRVRAGLAHQRPRRPRRRPASPKRRINGYNYYSSPDDLRNTSLSISVFRSKFADY